MSVEKNIVEKLELRARERKEFMCPNCKEKPMKVNHDFHFAQCFNCGYYFSWHGPADIAFSVMRLAFEIVVKKHGKAEAYSMFSMVDLREQQ